MNLEIKKAKEQKYDGGFKDSPLLLLDLSWF